MTVVVVALAGALGACSSSGSKAGPPASKPSGSSTTESGTPTLAGEWRGSWNRTAPDLAVGNIVLELKDHSGTLSGTVQAYGDTCLTGVHPLTGSLKGSTAVMTVMSKGAVAKFSGKVLGQQFSGSLGVVCAKGGGTGTFGVFQT